MSVEIYVRMRVGDLDPIDVQRDISDIAGYIGSYIVELESPDVDFPFDIIAGFNGRTSHDVENSLDQVKALVGEDNVRAFRNRNQVPPSIGRPLP